MTPLLATVLQLTEQFNECLSKYHQDSSIKFCTLGTENCHVLQCKSASLIFVDFLSDFFWQIRFYNEIFLGNMALLIRSYHGKMSTMAK